MFDITILPLLLIAGRERSELPGLYVAAAPRKATRLRAQDQLMLFMSLANNSPGKDPVYSPAQQQEMLTRLAETFYTTTGSITAGLRAVVTRLNDFLLSRNLRAHAEVQVTGSLNLAVLHGNTLLLAHAGSTQSMVLSKSQVQLFDDRSAGRGLGLNKQLVPRFYQTVLEPGDVLLVSAAPPDSWSSKALSGASQLALDHLRRRLLGQAGVDITAVALKFQPGKGQIIRYRVGAERGQAAAGEQSQRPAAPPTSSAATRGTPSSSAPTPLPEVPPSPAASTSPDVSSPRPASLPPQPEEIDWLELPASGEEPEVEAKEALDEKAGELPHGFAGVGEELPGASPDEAPDEEKGLAETAALSSASLKDEPPGVVEAHPRKVDEPAPAVSRPVRPVKSAREAQAVSGVPGVAGGQRIPQARPEQSAQRARPAGAVSSQQAKVRPRRKPGSGLGGKVGLGLKSVANGIAGVRTKVAGWVGPLVSRVFPQRSEPLINLSPASMLFIAICVPLVVVAIATTVYFNAGRAEQFILSVNNARQYVDRASLQAEDPQAQRESWTQALLWLDKAEQYGRDADSDNLRVQALGGMDALDGIVRLAYREAVSESFAVGVNITRMAATLNDVYLLDSTEGRVMRITRVADSYMVDPTFVCGPGQAGGQIIGPMIDMSVLPPNNTYRATILATDAFGNLVYCAPGQTGYDSIMMPAPDTNWGNIKAIEVADGYIYVLDPLVNAVWYIFGNNESIFNSEPRLFFSNQVPQMSDVVDFSIDKGFLYLLHKNGQMTTCEASGFELSPTRCDDPAPYGDARIGRDPAPLNFGDAHFVQIQTTQPPDPSLFILDDSQASIYHFSLRRMNLQRQYRPVYEPDFPLPERPPTAFVVTPNRRVLLAFANLIFFAPLP